MDEKTEPNIQMASQWFIVRLGIRLHLAPKAYQNYSRCIVTYSLQSTFIIHDFTYSLQQVYEIGIAVLILLKRTFKLNYLPEAQVFMNTKWDK